MTRKCLFIYGTFMLMCFLHNDTEVLFLNVYNLKRKSARLHEEKFDFY